MAEPRIERYLQEVRKFYANGKVFFGAFEPIDSEQFNEAWFTDRQGPEHPVLSLLNSDSFRRIASELVPGSTPKLTGPLSLCWLGPFAFEGALTDTLLSGGAYYRFHGSEIEARGLAKDFCDAVLGERHFERSIEVTHTPWSEWFKGVAWDRTFFISDYRNPRWTLLCLTDTD